DNADLLKQFLPESYRRVMGLTSLEGAILRFSDQIDHQTLQQLLHLVRPYSPDFQRLRARLHEETPGDLHLRIDQLLNRLIIDEDLTAALEILYVACERGLDLELLLEALEDDFSGLAYELGRSIIRTEKDESLVSTAFRVLREH